MNLSQNLEIISKVLMPLLAALISYLLFRQTRKTAQDNWDMAFNNIHIDFWRDEDIKIVRMWLANDWSYQKIKNLMEKRAKIGNNDPGLLISEDEYKQLDKLDKFLNHICRVVYLVPKSKAQVEVWKSFFFKYWAEKCLNENRPELKWYVLNFYEPLRDINLNKILRSLNEQTVDFKNEEYLNQGKIARRLEA